MTVIVGKLRILQFWIQISDVAEKLLVRPLAPWRGAFRITFQHLMYLRIRRVLLLLRPHRWRIGLVVPHRVAEESVHEHVRLVHVTDDALTRRNRAGEPMLEWMARLGVTDRRV